MLEVCPGFVLCPKHPQWGLLSLGGQEETVLCGL